MVVSEALVEGDSDMRPGFLRTSRYSPGNMDAASLEALFIGREEIMQEMVSRVMESICTPAKHYLLLRGSRGSGKTHTLVLAHQRIFDRIKALGLEDRAAIVFLNEQEWGITSYLDFLVRILRALAEQRPEIERDLFEVFERFSRSYKEAEYLASSLVAEHTRGRTLLLLCENLCELFRGLGEEGQKWWRADIQERRNWCIVATTPALLADMRPHEYPFFGLFSVTELEKLDVETGRELLIKKALNEDKPEMAAFLRTPLGSARARAIHHLAAGNCRAYVTLSDFLQAESLDDLTEPFIRLLDDLIPCYQDRMNQMPPAQRKIVDFLCFVSTPKAIKNIAAACLMSPQTASKQIAELAAAKIVNRIPSGRNTFCELTEPLMRMCLEVKANRTHRIRLFVEFLRHWFSARDPANRLEAHGFDYREPRRERRLLKLDAGEYDAAAENVARLEARSTNSLTSRLLAIQVSATTTPLDTVFERLDFEEDMVKDENIEAFSAILSVSVRAFGPRYLHQGVLALQKLLSNAHFNGILGVVLTIFVRENAKAFEGSLEHWDDCLNRLSHSLADQPDTEIPLQMLNAAVRYSKSADERHLLSLPLEQRQLLTDILHREEG